MYVEVRFKGQITLPAKARARFHIVQGDLLEIVESERGIFLQPKKLVDAGDAWFWSKEWQEAEREAGEDINKGRLSGPFKSAADYKRHILRAKKTKRGL